MKLRFQFRLRTLLVLVTLVAVFAAVAAKIAREQRIRSMILDDWTFLNHSGGASGERHIAFFTTSRCEDYVIRSRGFGSVLEVGAQGRYEFDVADKTVRITWDSDDTASPSLDPIIYCGAFDDNGNLHLHPEQHPGTKWVLQRTTSN